MFNLRKNGTFFLNLGFWLTGGLGGCGKIWKTCWGDSLASDMKQFGQFTKYVYKTVTKLYTWIIV